MSYAGTHGQRTGVEHRLPSTRERSSPATREVLSVTGVASMLSVFSTAWDKFETIGTLSGYP